MPNIVQFNRINSDSSKTIHDGTLREEDFVSVYDELMRRGFLERDNLIDLEYLKNRTADRLFFPKIIESGVELHPFTFVYPRVGSPKIILTADFLKDPRSAVN